MSLIFNNTEVDKVIYNGVELDKVIYNGVVVWEGGDEFIATVRTGFGTKNDGTQIGNQVSLSVTAGAKGCTVIWDNETVTVPANTTQTVTFTRNAVTTSTLKIKGDFTAFKPTYNYYNQNNGTGNTLYIRGITKWYSKLNKIQENLFAGRVISGYPLDFDINLPSNITDTGVDGGGSPFWHTDIPSTINFTFTDLDEFCSFGSPTTFFANATNNGDVWSINGCVLATTSGAVSRTDTFVIPNGTRKLPKGLFNLSGPGTNVVSTASFKLTGIQFPTDNLITKIPSYFLDGATSLTSISFPASVVKFDDYACRQGASSTSKFNEITFNTPRNMPITFGLNAFYSKSAKAVNVYTDNNPSVLNYGWSGFTPTFYKLDRTTQIPTLTTPTITRNNNIFSIGSVSGASKYNVTISRDSGNAFITADLQQVTVEFNSAPTNINVYDYVDQPFSDKTTYYRIICYCYNTNGDYVKSANSTETWSVEV